MSNFGTAVKLLVVFGLLALLVTAMLGGPSPFEGLQSTLSQGVTFPVFDDPFSPRRITFTLSPVANGTDYNPPDAVTDTLGSVDDCDNGTTGQWWGCLTTDDGNGSFVSESTPGPSFSVMLDEFFGASGSFPVLSVQVDVSCRATGGSPVNTRAEFNFFDGGSFFQLVTPVICKPGDFASQSLRQELSSPYSNVGNYSGSMLVLATDTPYLVDYSYVLVTVEYSPITECTGDALAIIACNIGQFFTFIINAIKFVVNGIAFVLVTFAVVLVFIGQVVVGLLLGIINMAVWFLAIDAPDVVKGIFGIFTVAAIAFPVLTVAQLIRGGGGM